MAGLILFVGIASLLYSHTSPLTLFLGSTFLLFSLVGFIDDFKKALFQDPSGVSGKTKLILQFTFTIGLLLVLFLYFSATSNIAVPGQLILQLNVAIYFILMLFFVVGCANAINFTDGLDGLLIMVAVPSYCFFFSISNHYEVQLFCLIMVASLMGLFLYNIYPAKAFMGDTGSLAIGGSLAFLSIIEKVELLTPILFFVYFAEQLSVILQVWYYKKTKLRIFRMTPIHFHYSLKYGWSENKIVIVFGAVSWICAIISWMIWKFLM